MTPLELLMSMDWTLAGPREVRDEDGAFFEMRVAELPDFFVAARTEAEVRAEAEDALRTFLASYVDRGELPPLPEPKWVFIAHAFGVHPSTQENANLFTGRHAHAAG